MTCEFLVETAEIVRGVFSARGPDSSVGGVPVANCPDVDHMEEEVQVSVQVEEEGHLTQCGVSHIIRHAHCVGEKLTCEVHCLHRPSVTVDCHQL